MSGVETVTVGAEERDMRLDRWFRSRYPELTQGRLQKLLRTGQVRVDGKRVKAGERLTPGQRVRVPPLPDAPRPEKPTLRLTDHEIKDLRARILHRDDAVLVIDKPAGLAVQGGSGQHRHLDAMLDALRLDGPERPRLVHRLDKETSGVLVLARRRTAAAALTAAFRDKSAQKVYWALVVGVPKPARGDIDLALEKRAGPAGDRVVAGGEGKRAVTRYAIVESAARRASWLAMMPLTGRTHQLRAHSAAIGTPIVGDDKYGGTDHDIGGLGCGLHLHARELTIPHPDGGDLHVVADLPPHMSASWRALGFSVAGCADPFLDAPEYPI